MPGHVPVYVVGDIHGHLSALRRVLRRDGLIGDGDAWTGAAAMLWFLGDYVDRGPDGIGVIDLIRRLQREAVRDGGAVHALLGSHEVLLLSAHRFGEQPAGGPGGTFRGDWERNGGRESDLAALTPGHVAWLTNLPAMAAYDGWLLMHADATFYRRYGRSVDAVNASLQQLLHGHDAAAWDYLLGEFSERMAFVDASAAGAANLAAMFATFGGTRLIHGHTPIHVITNRDPTESVEALVYAGGRCVNTDSGLYLGAPGFIYRLPA